MTETLIYAEGDCLVVEIHHAAGSSVQSFTCWWRYFWKEKATRAIENAMPQACVEIDSLKIV